LTHATPTSTLPQRSPRHHLTTTDETTRTTTTEQNPSNQKANTCVADPEESGGRIGLSGG
jgi:hypothetical protein